MHFVKFPMYVRESALRKFVVNVFHRKWSNLHVRRFHIVSLSFVKLIVRLSFAFFYSIYVFVLNKLKIQLNGEKLNRADHITLTRKEFDQE